MASIKKAKRIRRHKKIRMNISGTSKRPRLFVYRSNQHIYAQLINDEKAQILASACDEELKTQKGKKSEIAKEVGKMIAKKAAEAKITEVVFDRGGILFHGRVKSLAEGAKEAGLKF